MAAELKEIGGLPVMLERYVSFVFSIQIDHYD
jgi:hypothetical protein